MYPAVLWWTAWSVGLQGCRVITMVDLSLTETIFVMVQPSGPPAKTDSDKMRLRLMTDFIEKLLSWL